MKIRCDLSKLHQFYNGYSKMGEPVTHDHVYGFFMSMNSHTHTCGKTHRKPMGFPYPCRTLLLANTKVYSIWLSSFCNFVGAILACFASLLGLSKPDFICFWEWPSSFKNAWWWDCLQQWWAKGSWTLMMRRYLLLLLDRTHCTPNYYRGLLVASPFRSLQHYGS